MASAFPGTSLLIPMSGLKEGTRGRNCTVVLSLVIVRRQGGGDSAIAAAAPSCNMLRCYRAGEGGPTAVACS